MAVRGEQAGRPELVRARRRRGLSQEAAAEAVGVSPTTWARWERGEQGVRARHRARMAVVFAVEAVEVERWVEGWAFVETPSWPLVDCGGGSLEATVKSADLLWRYEMDPSRRHLLATLPFVPAALGEWLTSWTYDTPAASTARAGAGRAVGMADVQRINEARQAFSQMDQQFGAGLVRPVVIKYLNSVVTPLLHGRYDTNVGSELMIAAAGLTEMAGWTAFDLGHHGQAQHHFGQALSLAKAGGDLLTGAWVLMTLTQQAIYLRETKWAPRLAGAAVDAARQGAATPCVLAFMLIKQAGAIALQRRFADTREKHSLGCVERLLGDAERLHAQGPAGRDPAWLTSYGQPGFAAALGACWQLAGEHARALACAETALRDYNERHPRAMQFTRVNAAEAYLGMRELEQALDTAKAAVPAARSLTSVRLVKRLREFAGQLEPYGDTMAVREFRDHLRSELAA
ncbi:helix-turn-helix domain-containing protein [Sphaerisporangium sp. NPDC004334]